MRDFSEQRFLSGSKGQSVLVFHNRSRANFEVYDDAQGRLTGPRHDDDVQRELAAREYGEESALDPTRAD